MASLVALGSTIYVPADFLGGSKGKKLTIEWSQSFKSCKEDYYLCKYTDKSTGTEGVIFAQANKIEEFKAKKIEGDEITLKVDEKFQYGQDSGKTKRFLVYHNKDHTPYQHRFISNQYTDIGGKAADFIVSLGYKDVGAVEEVTKKFWGDYLKNF